MQRISTSATLMLKFFIPTFWMAFFGIFTLTILFINKDVYGRISIHTLQLVVLGLFLLGCLLWWRTVMGLKRMEVDEDFLYVTNYFKTFRYPYDSIEQMHLKDYKFFKTLRVELKEAGSFGKKMNCVISEKLFTDFMGEHPKVAFQFGFRPKSN